jgi:hypothetical protein
MPVAFVQEFDVDPSGDRSTTNYDHVMERVDLESAPPEGLVVHTAGFDEEGGVFRILDVWESQAHCERFIAERLQPILDEGPRNPENAGPPTRQGFYDLHTLVKP